MNRRWQVSGLLAIGSLLVTIGAHGQPVDLSGGVTLIALGSHESELENDRTFSGDLFLQKATSGGQWFGYLEANSSLAQGRLSTQIAEANADAGSALDPDRRGRVQLSELNYQFINAGSRITLGLLDPSAYLDRSRITNDENVQFLGASFVNNPTIEFPDYTLGMVYQQPGQGLRPQVNAVLASAAGLADNPNLSYSQLFQVADDEDGVFAALGLGWERPASLLRLGAWINSQHHVDLKQASATQDNYGIYALAGQTWGEHGVSARIGFANEQVSEGSAFTALAWRWLHGSFAVGAGWAKTWLSAQAEQQGRADSTQAEIYARYDHSQAIHLTASLQQVRHSDFAAQAGDPRREVLIAGLRLHLSFD